MNYTQLIQNQLEGVRVGGIRIIEHYGLRDKHIELFISQICSAKNWKLRWRKIRGKVYVQRYDDGFKPTANTLKNWRFISDQIKGCQVGETVTVNVGDIQRSMFEIHVWEVCSGLGWDYKLTGLKFTRK